MWVVNLRIVDRNERIVLLCVESMWVCEGRVGG
jgi:hypothetical protein